ncbi:MAG: hypothetical protein IH608_04840 [Proteobacteria bacterium]|nr:hypothetical protein [Pseudomonadota bacterium]
MAFTATAVVVAWVLYTGMLLGRFRATQGRHRLLEMVCAGWVAVVLGGILAAECNESVGVIFLWAETVLVPSAVAVLLLTSWLAFRADHFAISPAADIFACFGATASLVSVLMVLATRLYPLAPFEVVRNLGPVASGGAPGAARLTSQSR